MHFTLSFALVAAALAAADNSQNATTTATTMSTATASSNGTMPSATGSASNTTADYANKIVTYGNGQCQDGNSSAINTFELGDGFPNFSRAKSPKFPGAESKSGGGWDVYWSIPQPKQGCRTIVMLPFLQHAAMSGGPGGNEIINAGNKGCYFANVPTDSDVLVSYCCGSDDCNAASLNATDLLAAPSPAKRRSSARRAALPAAPEPKPEPKVVPQPDQVPRQQTARESLSSSSSEVKTSSEVSTTSAVSQTFDRARRWFYGVEKPQSNNCKIVKSGQPYSVAGPQIVVSRSQTCSDSPCTIQVQFTTQVSTTASATHQTTIDTTVEGSVSVEAGIDFLGLADAKTSMTIGGSLSTAISDATGMAYMSGNSSSVTNTIPIHLGTHGAVTFTPTYKCISGPIDCGKGPSDPIHWCQPDMSGPGGSINGDYNAVAYG